jgi:hypothetical protein
MVSIYLARDEIKELVFSAVGIHLARYLALITRLTNRKIVGT